MRYIYRDIYQRYIYVWFVVWINEASRLKMTSQPQHGYPATERESRMGRGPVRNHWLAVFTFWIILIDIQGVGGRCGGCDPNILYRTLAGQPQIPCVNKVRISKPEIVYYSSTCIAYSATRGYYYTSCTRSYSRQDVTTKEVSYCCQPYTLEGSTCLLPAVVDPIEPEVPPETHPSAGDEDQPSYLRAWTGEECGRSPYINAGEYSLPTPFIIGGQLTGARPHEFPWQVSLRFSPGWSEQHYCGGVIINRNWVLTAAHCASHRPYDHKVVVVGVHSRLTPAASQVVHGLRRIVSYPDFDDVFFTHDIALLQTERPMAFSAYVAPACPPQPGQSYTHRKAVASGWGTTVRRGFYTPSDALNYTTLNITTNSWCNERYNGYGYEVSRGMLCTTDNRGSEIRDSCKGDSGGPLTVKEGDRFHLVGLVSWGLGCASGYPGVYARVSEYLIWIRNTMDAYG